MRRIGYVFTATACLAVVATLCPAQQPEGKRARKGGSSDASFVDSFVARMMAFDKNKDGKLTREEITDRRLLRLFDRADTNKDGVVTREELMALAKTLAEEQAADGGERGPRGDGPPGPGGFGPPGGGRGPGFGGPPRPGQVLPPRLQQELNLTDAQKRQVEALQRDVDSRLEKILTDDQRQQLKEMRGRGPGGPPGQRGPRGPGPGGPPD
jgi:hypothetical protein